MRALDRMLLSDLIKMWRQGIAISLLLACGIATFVMSTSAMQSLDKSREVYYSEYRFADLFTSLTRAPNEIADRLRRIAGVAQVQDRIVHGVLLDMPNLIEPASLTECIEQAKALLRTTTSWLRANRPDLLTDQA